MLMNFDEQNNPKTFRFSWKFYSILFIIYSTFGIILMKALNMREIANWHFTFFFL